MTQTQRQANPFARLGAAELAATVVRSYGKSRIPGFLQHPALTRALHAAAHALHPLTITVDELLARREASRAAMRSAQRQQTEVVLHLDCLRRTGRAFGSDVAKAQLDWILHAVEGDTEVFGEKTMIRALPLGGSLDDRLGDFTVVLFADTAGTADERDLVYTEDEFGIAPLYLGTERFPHQGSHTWRELL